MKIKSIKSIKDFHIYKNFEWDSLPEFKKYNLFFGHNGSGKTTLSKIFLSIEKKEKPEKGIFIIEDFENNKINSNDLETFEDSSIFKTFNSAFVSQNISFDDLNPKCNPILCMGEKNIETKKEIKTKEENLKNLNEGLELSKKERLSLENNLDEKNKELAREIKNIINCNKLGDFYYSYDKSNILRKIEEGLDSLEEISKERYDDLRKIISSKKISRIEIKQKNQDMKFNFEDFIENSKVLLSKTIISNSIEKLKCDSELNDWTRVGLDLHTKREESECLFCGKKLNEDLIEKLNGHFNDESKRMIAEIDSLKNSINTNFVLEQPVLINFHLKFENKIEEILGEFKIINSKFHLFKEQIDNLFSQKKKNFFETYDIPDYKFYNEYQNLINKINKIITENNNLVENYEEEINIARKGIENYHLKISLNDEYFNKKIKINKLQKEIEDSTQKCKKVSTEIISLKDSISNFFLGKDNINKYLDQCFGHKYINLDFDDETKSYKVLREGRIAENLSEGEKTAIAFAYFLAKLREDGFNLSESIVFIDDPISSFDSNRIYLCASLIKRTFNEVGQFFISTHNFEFFNLMKDWMKNKNKNKDNPKSEFYFIKRTKCKGESKSLIEEMNRTLKNYKSEYHYLFYLLDCFLQDNENMAYSEFYLIGNVARKFTETFLSFKVPNSRDVSSKLDVLIKEIEFSEIQKERLQKMLNDGSHAGDIYNAIHHKDKEEFVEMIKDLMSFVKKIDKIHYDFLMKEIQ